VKRVLAVLIVVLIVIPTLLGVWLSGIGHRSEAQVGRQSAVAGNRDQHDAIDAPIAAQDSAGAERVILGAPDSSVTPGPTFLSVDRVMIRSSIGLELPFAEIQRDAGEWMQVDLEHGTCVRSALAGASSVRAPGHVAAALVSDAQEIVLEPEALLTLHADGLRNCVRAIEPWDPYTDPDTEKPLMRSGLRHAIAFGWLSGDEWAVALSPDRLEEGYQRGCELVIHWHDERTTRATFRGKPGCRETWSLVCEDRVRGRPLKIHVVRPVEMPAGKLSIALDRVMSGGIGTPMAHYSWGSAYTDSDQDFHQRRELEPGASDVDFSFAPSDARLNLAARDTAGGAYGRMDFVHDGSARTLVLVPPFRLIGHLVAPEGSPLPPHADMYANAFEGNEENYQWGLGKQGVEITASGSFELLGPGNLLRIENAPVEVPARLVLNVVAPGFEAWQKSFDTHHAALLDCGDIRLVDRPAEVVLAPGHGLTAASVKWESLTTPDEKQITWNVRDAILLADGSLAISLDRDEKNPKLLRAWPDEARAWPDPPPACLSIHVLRFPGDEPLAFERDADGRYRALETKVRDVDFDFRSPLDHARWMIGWEWRGISDVCESIDPMQHGELVRLHVRAPAQGVTLIWTTDWEHRSDSGVRGGSMPINSALAPIVLR
jgi:hypothetical protein